MEERPDGGRPRRCPGEADAVEVDEVEDVGDIDLPEPDEDRVAGVAGGLSVGDDVLVAVGEFEVVDREAVPVVGEVGGLHLQGDGVEVDGRRVEVQPGLQSAPSACEGGGAADVSVYRRVARDAEGDVRGDAVLGDVSLCVQDDVRSASAFPFGGDVRKQSLRPAADVQQQVSDVLSGAVDAGCFDVQVQSVVPFVHSAVYPDGTGGLDGCPEEAVEHPCVVQLQGEGVIGLSLGNAVLRMRVNQAGKIMSQYTDDALRQRGIVVLSGKVQFAEVGPCFERPAQQSARSLGLQPSEADVLFLAGHGEAADGEASGKVVEAGSLSFDGGGERQGPVSQGIGQVQAVQVDGPGIDREVGRQFSPPVEEGEDAGGFSVDGEFSIRVVYRCLPAESVVAAGSVQPDVAVSIAFVTERPYVPFRKNRGEVGIPLHPDVCADAAEVAVAEHLRQVESAGMHGRPEVLSVDAGRQPHAARSCTELSFSRITACIVGERAVIEDVAETIQRSGQGLSGGLGDAAQGVAADAQRREGAVPCRHSPPESDPSFRSNERGQRPVGQIEPFHPERTSRPPCLQGGIVGFRKGLQGGQQRGEVGRRDRCPEALDGIAQRAVVQPFPPHAVVGRQLFQRDAAGRCLEVEVAQRGMAAAGLQAERQLPYLQACRFPERQRTEVGPQAGVFQLVEDEIGRDAAHADVVRIQPAGRAGRIETVVPDAAVAYDEAVDGEVERGMGGGVFRGQRVQGELEVGAGGLVCSVEIGLQPEDLCRRDVDLSRAQ